jgi:hypothetical protein
VDPRRGKHIEKQHSDQTNGTFSAPPSHLFPARRFSGRSFRRR